MCVCRVVTEDRILELFPVLGDQEDVKEALAIVYRGPQRSEYEKQAKYFLTTHVEDVFKAISELPWKDEQAMEIDPIPDPNMWTTMLSGETLQGKRLESTRSLLKLFIEFLSGPYHDEIIEPTRRVSISH